MNKYTQVYTTKGKEIPLLMDYDSTDNFRFFKFF